MAFKCKITLFIVVLFLIACGNRRSPTGGPVDNERPEILFTEPLEFDNIENNRITIAFTKRMDKNSVESGLYINPPIVNKKLKWNKTRLTIEFNEKLKDNTNYTVFLNNTIKCERNNTLNEDILLVFKNGELQKNQISGLVYLGDEEKRNIDITKIREINFSLRDKDSLLVFVKKLDNINIGQDFSLNPDGKYSYKFNFLNPGKYHLNVYADINENKRFDKGTDPQFYSSILIPSTQYLNVELAVSDTTKPNLKRIINPAKNQLILEFNKEISQQRRPIIYISNDSTGVMLNILYREYLDNKLYLLTSPMDSLSYKLQLSGLFDRRGNQRQTLVTYFSSFGQSDKVPNQMLSLTPRDGTVVSDLKPLIEISFDKLIFAETLNVELRDIENDIKIPLKTVKSKGFDITFTPEVELQEFRSYKFVVKRNSRDFSGNEIVLKKDNFRFSNIRNDDNLIESQFIVTPGN